MKRAFYLTKAAGKLNRIARLRHALDLEAMSLEPGFQRLQVRVAHAKLIPERIRRQPLVVARRVRVLHIGQVLRKCMLLHDAAPQNKLDASGRRRNSRLALVIARHSQRMHVSGQRRSMRFVNRLGNTRSRLNGRGRLRQQVGAASSSHCQGEN